jgi:hypothetical protein
MPVARITPPGIRVTWRASRLDILTPSTKVLSAPNRYRDSLQVATRTENWGGRPKVSMSVPATLYICMH